jgi:hypothetical protein
MHHRTPHFYIRGYTHGRAIITRKRRRKTAEQKVEYAILRMFGVEAAREYRRTGYLGDRVVGPASSFATLKTAGRQRYKFRSQMRVR